MYERFRNYRSTEVVAIVSAALACLYALGGI